MRIVASLLFALGYIATAPVAGAEGRCALEVQRVNEGFFAIVGKGFEPSESVELQLRFGGEPVFPIPLAKVADELGAFTDGLSFLPDDQAGRYRLAAIADSCSTKATIVWLPDTAIESSGLRESASWQLFAVISSALIAFVAVFAFVHRGAQSHET